MSIFSRSLTKEKKLSGFVAVFLLVGCPLWVGCPEAQQIGSDTGGVGYDAFLFLQLDAGNQDSGQHLPVDSGQLPQPDRGGHRGNDAATVQHDAFIPPTDGAIAVIDSSFVMPDADFDLADGAGYYAPDASVAILAELCPPEDQVTPGCMAAMDEGYQGLCDGLDNDCDGEVDDGCSCKQGEVQRCFRGPPGLHNVGACEDGYQNCMPVGESQYIWGPCEGGIAPGPEVCDDLDNDCNGCTDELESCAVAVGSCPGPGDPRIPDGQPFSNYALNGADFYPGTDALSWNWNVVGTPCDRMFMEIPGSTATPSNGQLSYRVHDHSSQNASVDFTLSGDYTVILTVTLEGGGVFACTWIIHVRAPGMRVELCWDATGPTASDNFGGTVDVDLHLAKAGVTPQWFDSADCDYRTCDTTSGVGWGYDDSPIENCTGPGARSSFYNSCPNPRLDIDNVSQRTEYVPENINLDNPNDGDQFRVMVHHFTSIERLTHPLVNVYCAGELLGSYGVAPDLVEDFKLGGGRNGGHMWRVVDITTQVDGNGVTTGCELVPISPDGATGYYITEDDSTY